MLDWFLNLELTKEGEGDRDLARDASSIANVEFEEHSVPLPNSYESHEERAVNKYIYIVSLKLMFNVRCLTKRKRLKSVSLKSE